MERLNNILIKIAMWMSGKPTWFVYTLALIFVTLAFLATMYITSILF